MPTSHSLNCPQCGASISSLPPGGIATCPNCGSVFGVEGAVPVEVSSAGLPCTLGKFQLLDLLGHGSFGAVYRARDCQLGRTVAVKIPRSGSLALARQEDFLREAKHAAQLDHPHIVPVYEVGRQGELPFIVCGFIEGRTLAEELAERQPSFRRSAELVAGVADALEYAHARHIVHCDVNPRNIMIDTAGSPHLTDFGLARRHQPDVVVTLDGQVVGTPAYMPPEQAAGEIGKVDARSDVYSLGVVLYELLTGERPFRGHVRMVLKQVLDDEPRPPRRLNDRIPRDLETICLKAMAKSPSSRYTSAEGLAADLRCFLDRRPISARPVGRVERLLRWCGRNRLAAGLAAALMLLIVGVVVGLAWEVVRIARSRDETQRLLSKAQGERGIGKLEAGNSDGLFDLVEANRTAGDAEEPRRSCALSWSAWYPAFSGRLRLLVSHDRPVNAAAFSPDGRLIATTSQDGTAQLWDALSGQPHAAASPNNPDARQLMFHRNGRVLVTRSTNTTIDFRATEDGQLCLPTMSFATGVSQLRSSRDGRWLAAFLSPATVRVWKLDEKPMEAPPRQFEVLEMAFSDDGRWLATASGKGVVTMWPSDSEHEQCSIQAHSKPVIALAFSPDGRLLATGAGDHTAQLWDVETGEARGPPLKHDEDVRAVAFDSSGSLLATASMDGAARIWDVAGGTLRHRLPHDGPVHSVAFSPDGRLLASASSDGTARVWDAATGQPYGWPFRHEGAVASVAFHPFENKLLTASSDGTARVWDLSSAGPLVLPHANRVWSVAFDTSGKRLVTASEDGLARVFDSSSGRLLGRLPQRPTDNGITQTLGVAVSGDGKYIATAGTACVQIWDAATLKPCSPFLEHSNVRVVAFSPDSALLASGGFDDATHRGATLLWNVSTGERFGAPMEQEGVVSGIAFSPDGKLLAAHSAGNNVHLWQTADQRPYGRPLVHAAGVEAMAFSPDSARLVTSARDRSVRLWSVANCEGRLLPIETRAVVGALAFSPDGRLLATGGGDGGVRLWDLKSGLACGPRMEHQGIVLCVAFSPDGRLLAAGSFDNTARIWPLGALVTDPRELELRTSLALGATCDAGDRRALTWREWQAAVRELRDLRRGLPHDHPQ